MIRGKAPANVAGRWLIVCDCAGHPEELVGVVDVTAAGEVRVFDTGRGGAPSMTDAESLLLDAPMSERRELLRQLKAREIPLPLEVSLIHPPCPLNLRVTEARFGELLTVMSGHVEGHRVTLSALCAVNGRLLGGATR